MSAKQIEPIDPEEYALDDMSLEDAPVMALIDKVNEIIDLLNSWKDESDK